MKKYLIILSTLALAGIALSLVPWIITFSPEGLSSDPADWAYFGGYFGGLMSPFFAALALVALLGNIHYQQKQINMTRNQSNKSDVLLVIDKLEEDYETTLKSFPIELSIGDERHRYTAFDCLDRLTFPEWEEVLVSQSDIDLSKSYPYNDDRLLRFELFGRAAGNLNQLRIYVELFDNLAKNNALSKYYHRKYKTHFERFEAKGLVRKWDLAWS